MRGFQIKPTRFFFVVLFAAAFGISACSFHNEKVSPDDTIENIPVELLSSVSYAMVNAKVFQPHCVSCHGNSGGVNLESFDTAKSVLGRIKTVLINKSMPKAPNLPLGPQEAQILAAWIKMGGPDSPSTGGPDTPPPPMLEPKFSSIKSIIIDRKCIRCHSVGGPAARVPLGTLDNLLNSPLDIVIPHNADESDIVLVLQDGARKKMPPLDSGITPVNAHDLNVIKEWINNGAID